MRRPMRSVSRVVFVVVVGVAVALGAARAAFSAAIPVDCTVDAGALASALAVATDGDMLAIQGTCTGSFVIAHSLTLSGSGSATLDGQQAGLVLSIAAGKTVMLRDLAVTGGNTPPFSRGGGIFNEGTLTLVRSVATGNTSGSFGGGGGIWNSGTLTLADSTVSGNHAECAGGIYNDFGRTMNMAGSTVSGNTASGAFCEGAGGIENFGQLTIRDSSVSGNTASGGGGGILSDGPLTIVNSTVSGNSADRGGGIYNFTTMTLSNTTVSDNNGGGIVTLGLAEPLIAYSTITRNSAPNSLGAGVYIEPGAGVTFLSTIIAGQLGGPNCGGGATVDGGYNLDDGTSCGFSAANHSLSSTNPLLDPAGLQDNGGQTKTIALQSGSPAIDAIPVGANGCGTTVTTDQRGVTRPQGAGCDIGSFEVVGDTTPPVISAPTAVTTNATSPAGATVTYTVTATDADDTVASLTCSPASGSTFAIGTTTVTCTASDTHGNTSRASFTVTVRGATEQLDDLLAAVNGVGPGQSLANKVTLIQGDLVAGDVGDACATLTAFTNQVNAQAGKKNITAAQAASLIAQAHSIEATLGC